MRSFFAGLVLAGLAGCAATPTSPEPVSPQVEEPAATTRVEDPDAWWPKDRGAVGYQEGFDGVVAFRGNPTRNYAGEGPIPTGEVRVLWRAPIGQLPGAHWSGVGWTGQPLLVAWPEEVRPHMPFLNPPGPEMELIQGALDGQVHFLDASTGKPSRRPIRIPGPAPIKGTVSLDPRGVPVLYVGCGLPQGSPAIRAYSLVTHQVLFELPLRQSGAPRNWYAADSNALVLRETLLVPGENGLLYVVRNPIEWDPATGQLSASPEIRTVPISAAGSEASIAVYGRTAFVPDNKGVVWAFDLASPDLAKRKVIDLGDDVDSSVVVDPDGALLIGSQIDKRAGQRGARAAVVRVDAGSGTELWRYEFAAQKLPQSESQPNPIDGGILCTVALDSATDAVLFTTSNDPSLGRGRLVCLERTTGELRWEKRLGGFAWSSPITVDGVVFAADSSGKAYVLDAQTGASLLDGESLSLGGTVEASPVVWQGRVYVGIRGGAVLCLGVR